MANKVSNPYIELYEQLSVPERLEPKNIAAMLESVKAAGAMPEKTSVKPAKKIAFSHNPAPEVSHEEISSEHSITRSNKSRKTTVAYRSIASIAACAALALGIFGYMNVGRPEIKTENNPGGGTYASDYDDVHKTFEKYYVGDSDKKTLDSALKEIEHSYNESENANGQGVNVPETRPETKPETPEVSTPEPVEPAAPSTESSVDNPAPSQTEPEPDDQPEVLPPEPPAEIASFEPLRDRLFRHSFRRRIHTSQRQQHHQNNNLFRKRRHRIYRQHLPELYRHRQDPLRLLLRGQQGRRGILVGRSA